MRDPWIIELEWLTRGIRAIRIARFGEQEMSRLDEKFAKAGGVVQRVEQRIEGRLDALIDREVQITEKTERVFDRHMAPVDDADKALDALESKLNLLSNGGPDGPLPGSGDSQEADPPKPQQTTPPANELAPVPLKIEPGMTPQQTMDALQNSGSSPVVEQQPAATFPGQ